MKILGIATMRTYDDGCLPRPGPGRGEVGTFVVCELLLGPSFTDLRTGIPKASPNVLSQRLRELQRAGVVRRRKLPPPVASRIHEPTDSQYPTKPRMAASPAPANHRADRRVGSVG